MRADWIDDRSINLILTALMPYNRLAMMVALDTGLRIDDVLSIRTVQLRTQRLTVVERKTGKHRRIYLPLRTYEYLCQYAGRVWAFEGRCDWRKHRTRQAVYKDLRRAATLYRIDGTPTRAHVSPHSARKVYAVHDLAAHNGDLSRVQRDLNHSDPAVTTLYAYADRLKISREVTKNGKKQKDKNA